MRMRLRRWVLVLVKFILRFVVLLFLLIRALALRRPRVRFLYVKLFLNRPCVLLSLRYVIKLDVAYVLFLLNWKLLFTMCLLKLLRVNMVRLLVLIKICSYRVKLECRSLLILRLMSIRISLRFLIKVVMNLVNLLLLLVMRLFHLMLL